jgi:hypothetical protein
MQHASRNLAAFLITLIIACSAQSFATCNLFVATPANGGNDSNSGTSSGAPFASFSRAQMAVRAHGHSTSVTICIGPETYYLPIAPNSTTTGTYTGTLLFNSSSDSGTSTHPVMWQANPAGSTVIVSGAVPVGPGSLGLSWTNVTGNYWKVTLPTTNLVSGGYPLQPFEYLYYLVSIYLSDRAN